MISDEAESSLQMIYSLLGDLGIDSKDAANFVESTRADLRVKQDDFFAAFEATKGAGLPVPSGSNRVNQVDEKFSPLKSLGPLLTDAKRKIYGWGSRRTLTPDDTQFLPKDENDRFGIVALDSETIPGVDICILPPREERERARAARKGPKLEK